MIIYVIGGMLVFAAYLLPRLSARITGRPLDPVDQASLNGFFLSIGGCLVLVYGLIEGDLAAIVPGAIAFVGFGVGTAVARHLTRRQTSRD